MYEQYYGLSEKPFDLTPDTDFYFQSLTHQEALNVLLVALESGDGFIKLTGEVGTGKTLLCRKLLDLLNDGYQTVYIPNPYMSCNALLKAVVDEMGLAKYLKDKDYLSLINKKLIWNARRNIKTVILMDEAQSLPVESLEAIRLLSNLETEKKKLVQIVLFGQPELDEKLSDKSIRQLQQRIVHACELNTLSAEVIASYINHRLESAGYSGAAIFSKRAINRLYKKTRGTPRLLNLLCNKALMLAYSSKKFHVNEKLIEQAARDSKQVKQAGFDRFIQAGLFGLIGLLTLTVYIVGQSVP